MVTMFLYRTNLFSHQQCHLFVCNKTFWIILMCGCIVLFCFVLFFNVETPENWKGFILIEDSNNKSDSLSHRTFSYEYFDLILIFSDRRQQTKLNIDKSTLLSGSVYRLLIIFSWLDSIQISTKCFLNYSL